MEENNINEEKIKECLGNDLIEKIIKIAKQLEKVDFLEKEIEEIKKRLEKYECHLGLTRKTAICSNCLKKNQCQIKD